LKQQNAGQTTRSVLEIHRLGEGVRPHPHLLGDPIVANELDHLRVASRFRFVVAILLRGHGVHVSGFGVN
jgi:hypothetical protein